MLPPALVGLDVGQAAIGVVDGGRLVAGAVDLGVVVAAAGDLRVDRGVDGVGRPIARLPLLTISGPPCLAVVAAAAAPPGGSSVIPRSTAEAGCRSPVVPCAVALLRHFHQLVGVVLVILVDLLTVVWLGREVPSWPYQAKVGVFC